MSIAYSIREGLKGFRRAKFASVASTGAIAVALIMIGVFSVMSYQAQELTHWLRQRAGEMEIFLDDVDDRLAAALHQRVKSTPGVRETEYISRSAAEAIFRQEFGEQADIYFDQPFLPASIKVRVDPAYANPDSLLALVADFESWGRIDEVVFNQALLQKVEQNLALVRTFGIWLGVVVLVAALFLVANTIRLTIYARRLLIRTMKLVGATDSFIRRPFIVEGILQGLLAGGVAVACVYLLYRLLVSYQPSFALDSGNVLPVFMTGIVLLGLLLGWAGSYFAVRRFVRKVALH